MAGWTGYPDSFADCAFYQGDYHAPAQFDGVIVNVARGNQGSYQETTWGAKQVQNARDDGKDLGCYFFNGNLDAYTCGVLFGSTLLALGFNVAADKMAVDCEDEGATNTHAWGPDQVAAFVNGAASVVIGLRWSNVLVYMNWDVNRRFNWSAIVSYGAQLWYARPGIVGTDQAWWPVAYAKQDGTYQGVDANGYTKTFAVSNGTAPTRSKESDVTTIISTQQASPDGSIPAGSVFVQTPNGPLRPISSDEYDIYNTLDKNHDRNLWAPWNGDRIQNLIRTVGCLEWTQVNGTYRYTGRIWYDTPTTAAYPTSGSALNLSDTDLAKIGAALPAPTIPTKFTITGEADAA